MSTTTKTGTVSEIKTNFLHMIPQIDFYWDIGSTNTYFALHLIQPIAARYGARIVPHPFNLGHVFRQHGYVLMQEPRAKLHHRRVDLHRWAVRHQLPFRMPDEFPIKTSRALRGALAMRRFDQEWPYMEAIFSAYWEHNDASISDYAGLRPIAARLGVDADAFERLSEDAAIRAELIAETDAGLARGAFGAPTFFVGEEMFWGKDRMEFLEVELAAHCDTTAASSATTGAGGSN
ncbi:MAG TPA: 2-hydroxychromene-2-carboxylate isomerase [Candidatus Binatia bacterium]|nr:2-hydroxychromene-2-carboxylate isomerase [Candidatus Binatia bacterium]